MTLYRNAKRYFITATTDVAVADLLTEHLAGKADARVVLAAGAVWHDRQRITDPGHMIRGGETLRVYITPSQGKTYDFDPSTIVFETEDFMVVNKPAGITSISDRSNMTYNLTHGVRCYYRAQKINYDPTPINRLDFMVSGLTIYAKHKAAEKGLFRLMAERRIHKMYLAVLLPQENPPKIMRVRDTLSFQGKTIQDPAGREAETLFRFREKRPDGDLYAVIPVTGRRHQIRFHAAAYLRPIIGDDLYGSAKGQGAIALTAVGYNFSFKGKKYRIRLKPPEVNKLKP